MCPSSIGRSAPSRCLAVNGFSVSPRQASCYGSTSSRSSSSGRPRGRDRSLLAEAGRSVSEQQPRGLLGSWRRGSQRMGARRVYSRSRERLCSRPSVRPPEGCQETARLGLAAKSARCSPGGIEPPEGLGESTGLAGGRFGRAEDRSRAWSGWSGCWWGPLSFSWGRLAFSRELLRPSLFARHPWPKRRVPSSPTSRGCCPISVGSIRTRGGLTFEIRDHKQPHWTGQRSSPATFGHFGGTGTFLCPEAGLATVVLTGRDFGPWALEARPSFSDAV